MGKLIGIKINNIKKPLYDIEIQDNHNFVVNNGIVVKNSEQYLSRDSLCVLSSINAEKFSTDPEQYEKELEKVGSSINRFLDNVNEMELRNKTYATPFQKLAIEKLRRTGAGVTNIAGWLFKKNHEYGSPDGNKAISHFMERYNYHLYKSSINLGKEKGNFGLFNKEKLERSPFIQRMKKLGLEFNTLRNISCSSIAPSGTGSLMFRNTVMSYGVEPSFGMYYWKRTRITGKYEYYFCVPNVVINVFKNAGYPIPTQSDTIKDTWDGKYGKPIADFIDRNKDKVGVKFKKATEVSPLDKLDLMSELMKSIDSSISVTYMLKEGSSWKDIYDFILLAYEKGVKSIAAFPDRKMYGIVSYVPFKELAIELKKENVQIHNQNFTTEELKQLDQELNTTSLNAGTTDGQVVKNLTTKRPKSLPCDVHHVKITKKLDKIRIFEYLVVVGLIENDKPYEVFALENGQLSKNYNRGEVIKHNKGKYDLVFVDGTKVENITKGTTESEDALTRMTSISLRHGVPIEFIVDQLEKVEGDLYTFSKSMARALKKYLKDGTKVLGFCCPSCGRDDTITRQEGCISCACGYSKCG